jgi:hypothetical protein
MVCMSFESIGDPCPFCKDDLLKQKKLTYCLLHNLLYTDVIFILIFYL